MDSAEIDYRNVRFKAGKNALRRHVICGEIPATSIFLALRCCEMPANLVTGPQCAEEDVADLLASLEQVASLRHHDDVSLDPFKLDDRCLALDGAVNRQIIGGRIDWAAAQNIALLDLLSLYDFVPRKSGHR